jgi:GTP-binding protein HflX
MILVLNKIDRLEDRTALALLQAKYPKAVSISGLTGEGLETLMEAVVSALSENFIYSEVICEASNGKVLAFLNAHAEVLRQEYRGQEAVIRCYLPKHLLHHIESPGVRVRALSETWTETG